MPYKIVKNPDGSYRVENKKTAEVHAKKTTKAKAKKQIAAMHMHDEKQEHMGGHH